MNELNYRVDASRPSIALELAQARAKITGNPAYIVSSEGNLYVQDYAQSPACCQVLERVSPRTGDA